MKFIISLIIFSIYLFSFEIKFPTLSTNELKFKELSSYSMQDFKLNRSITYLEVISFETEPYTGNDFKLKEPFTYKTLLSIGVPTNSNLAEKSRKFLANIIIKENYFWKWQEYPKLNYRFNIVNFYEKRDNRMKAYENQEEIREALRRIDTEAELLLWAKLTSSPNLKPYSYLKMGKLYRVRFFNVSKDGCHIKELFKFYKNDGSITGDKLIRDEAIKNCQPTLQDDKNISKELNVTVVNSNFNKEK